MQLEQADKSQVSRVVGLLAFARTYVCVLCGKEGPAEELCLPIPKRSSMHGIQSSTASIRN